ncbi:MAG TPA: hypothetical protein DCZ13_13705 [Porticoccaceae bacterium]|nr:hypothetical protein [Porticoccaceae bacterium]
MARTDSPASTPGESELKKFGIVTGALIILLIGGLIPWLWNLDIMAWQRVTAPIGGVLILWALVWPRGLKLVYTPWMALAEKIGWFNTRLILFLIFYGVVLPIGLLMRLLGKDPLARKYDPRATSYRIENTPQDKDHMETPY